MLSVRVASHEIKHVAWTARFCSFFFFSMLQFLEKVIYVQEFPRKYTHKVYKIIDGHKKLLDQVTANTTDVLYMTDVCRQQRLLK